MAVTYDKHNNVLKIKYTNFKTYKLLENSNSYLNSNKTINILLIKTAYQQEQVSTLALEELRKQLNKFSFKS